MSNKFLYPAIFAAISSAACTSPPDPAWAAKLWGDPASVSSSARTIRIGPDTRYVNIAGGETVNFAVGGKTFAWKFDGPSEGYKFDLATVAPQGMLDHDVTAFVDADPAFMGGR